MLRETFRGKHLLLKSICLSFNLMHEIMDKVSYQLVDVNQFIKSKITPLFMSLATLINRYISNLAKILLKEIKDMKIDRKKKKVKTNDNS